MNLENMTLRSHLQKTTYCQIPITWNVQNRQIHREREWISGCQGQGYGEWGVTANGYGVSFFSLFFFLVRKFGPELTRVPIFLFFLEKDCCWANICASLPLFCMWDAATEWLDEWCVGLCPGSELGNPGPLKWSSWTSPLCHCASPTSFLI